MYYDSAKRFYEALDKQIEKEDFSKEYLKTNQVLKQYTPVKFENEVYFFFADTGNIGTWEKMEDEEIRLFLWDVFCNGYSTRAVNSILRALKSRMPVVSELPKRGVR